MKPKAYVETSVISYYTARPSRDLVVAAHQEITHDWWDNQRSNYNLYTSQVVHDEAGAGDPDAAAKRIQALQCGLIRLLKKFTKHARSTQQSLATICAQLYEIINDDRNSAGRRWSRLLTIRTSRLIALSVTKTKSSLMVDVKS
jgi:hypothetical protein